MQIDFLMRVLAIVMAGDIPGNDDNRNTIQRGVRNTRGGIGQARAQMAHDDGCPAGGPGITVGCMGRNLFMADVDKRNRTILQGG